jgi:putative transposase
VEYEHSAHAVHLLIYHLVWCPKFRRPVLVGDVASRLRALIAQITVEHGWDVLELAIQPDHVHLFLRCLPTDSPHLVVRQVKGQTSRVLRQEFAGLRRRLPTLWTRAYFVSTAGNVSAATIKRYIAAQKGV